MTKAEIARQLRISRAYVTMIINGERQPSRKLKTRIEKLTRQGSLSDTFFANGVQVVAGSNPAAPTIF